MLGVNPNTATNGASNQPNQAAAGIFRQPAGCVVIGPKGAGKTFFLWAISQACNLPSDDGFRFRFQPASSNTADFARQAVDFSLDPSLRPMATDHVAVYDFDLDLFTTPETIWNENPRAAILQWVDRKLGNPPPIVTESAQFHIIDGPGGHLFPVADEQSGSLECAPELIAHAQKSQSLIICVNSAEPWAHVVSAELPVFIENLRGPDGCLPFRNVLLLLTQIDRMTDHFMGDLRDLHSVKGSASSSALKYLGGHPGVPPKIISDFLDPLNLSRYLLGERVIHELWQSVSVGSKLGIGVCSAWGFDTETGRPFVDESSLNGNNQSEPLEKPLQWRPFGVREALYFIMNTGKARDRRIGMVWEYVKDPRHNLPLNNSIEILL